MPKDRGKLSLPVTQSMPHAMTHKESLHANASCTGEKGMGKAGKPLHFKGSIFHRVIPGFMCQV